MLDWPNLLIGALLGAALATIPWAIDHRLARRSSRDEAYAGWVIAARQLAYRAAQDGATFDDLMRLARQYPITAWRETLGEDDFKKLDEMLIALAMRDKLSERADLPLGRTIADRWVDVGMNAFLGRVRDMAH